MISRSIPRTSREGAVAPLTAVLMIVFLAMAAFAVDIGYMAVVQSELQNTADSAALAGASQLLLPQITGNPNTNALATATIPKAKNEAKTFSAYNTGGGTNLSMADNDIIVGYQSSGSTGDVTTWVVGNPFPNSVQVLARRDSTLNNPVSLFFGKVFGTSNWSSTATATAAVQANKYYVTGFNATPGGKTPLLLPIAVDVNYWNTFLLTGQSPDGVVRDGYKASLPTSSARPPANVGVGSDNIPEITDVYPNRTSPGNFGLLNLNYTDPVNNVPAFSNWILNGPSVADIQSFGPNGFQATPNAPVSVKGGPGLKSTLVSDFNAIRGQPRAVPLFTTYTGQGSNTYYTIVGFAGVTVVDATGSGSNISIVFQPMITIDPTATTGSSSSGTITKFVYPSSPVALTR